MKFPSVPLFTASLASLLLAWTDARAAFVHWSYNWSRVPADVVSADAFGTSRISLTDEPLGRATNSSDIVATNIRTSSTAPRATPNNFLDAAYTLTLRLTDDASGETGTLSFSGVFNGTLSSSSADISTTITSPLTQSLTLGGNEYIVTMDAYSPPGPPGINNAGSLSAHVEVRPAQDSGGGEPPPPNDTPEPSTVVLSGLGLSLFGAVGWRRWKARRPVPTVA
ncbi:MAG TPA: PEP-CTERM sorting domain-containing protein [Gemmataceae bacterium]|nr:PEP-CTERM sorting domain-containing protein [Gemmataceae bacterium]